MGWIGRKGRKGRERYVTRQSDMGRLRRRQASVGAPNHAPHPTYAKTPAAFAAGVPRLNANPKVRDS